MEAAESGRPEDPTSLRNLPRDPPANAGRSLGGFLSKGKGRAEALRPSHSRMRHRKAGLCNGNREGGDHREGVREGLGAHCLTGTNPARPYLWGAAACAQSSRTSQPDECQGNWH